MASVNVMEWIETHVDRVGASALEVGSRRYKEHAYLGLREFLAARRPEVSLLGCDLSAGDNVDVQVDLTADHALVAQALGSRRFDTIFCVSVLEHVPDVFAACKNIAALLQPGGSLFVSVPFVFRYHGYPGDLWRFTPEAVCALFPTVDFKAYADSMVSTLELGDCMNLAGTGVEKLNRFIYRPKGRESKIQRKQAKLEGKPVEAYSLAPCMINMLGTKV